MTAATAAAARRHPCRSRPGIFTFAAVLLVLSVPLRAQGRSVSFGVTHSADTVTVGQAFEVRVRVRASRDADSIRFAGNPDTSFAVQARDPRLVITNDTTQWLDQTAVYRLSAWDVGTQPVRIGKPVVVWSRASGGGEHAVALAPLEVFVRSVLPADSALRVPKPARPLWEPKLFPWWIVALVVAAIITGLLLWWWIRRRRRPAAAPPVDPFVRAQREFNRLEATGLVDAGEATRYIALTVEVLRDYLAARFPDASLALTSRELVAHLRRHSTVPLEQLSRVLHEADLAKFAAWTLTEDRARALGQDTRGVVEREHTAWREWLAAQAAAAAAAAQGDSRERAA